MTHTHANGTQTHSTNKHEHIQTAHINTHANGTHTQKQMAHTHTEWAHVNEYSINITTSPQICGPQCHQYHSSINNILP